MFSSVLAIGLSAFAEVPPVPSCHRELSPNESRAEDKSKRPTESPECQGRICLRKCCPRGRTFFNRTCSQVPEVPDFRAPPVNFTRPLCLLYGFPKCPEEKMILEPGKYPQDIFYIDPRGMLVRPKVGFVTHPEDYCLEEGLAGLFPVVCFVPATPDPGLQLYPYGMILSLPCLLIVLVVYIILPEFDNFHGHAVRCHIFSLFFAYLSLGTVLLAKENMPFYPCLIFGK
ncbi:hypothetical protein AAG570_010419 [Ranatra chinensis]|uniref:Uncharacterized protein n=1 Tax=Ranatra chinensis TaxID=642074 RepID=A0ABD0ZAU1_9HEMI